MDAIVKGSIAVPKYCQMGNQGNSGHSWLENLSDYEVPDLPKEIVLPNGESIPVTADSLTYDFDLNGETSGIHCYLQFFIKCNKVFKTAGMGDTITATGWIYHTPKSVPLE